MNAVIDHIRARTLGLGLITLVPLAYLAVFLYVLFPQLEGFFGKDSARYAELFRMVLWLHLGAILLVLLLLAFYLRQARRSPHVPNPRRGLWVALLLIGNMFAMPVFWYLYIWRPRPSLPEGSRLTSA